MKILHRYEDGTLKVVYQNGKVGLYKPSGDKPKVNSDVKDVELKILMRVDGKIYTIPISGGLPAETDQSAWIRISGSTYSELIYKVIVNAGMLCGHALGHSAQHYFISNIFAIKEALFGKEETK